MPFNPLQNPENPAFIFDFGAVLIDWNPYHLYRKMFPDDAAIARFLKEVDFMAWNHQQDLGRPFAEAVVEMVDRFPGYAEPIRAYHTRWIEMISGPIQPTVDVMAALRSAGFRLYGLSNWSLETFSLIHADRDRYPFFDWLEDMVISGAVGIAKPDPGVYQLLLDRIGLPASACIFIDDSPANIDTAEKMGFHAIQFTSPAVLAAQLARYLPDGFQNNL